MTAISTFFEKDHQEIDALLGGVSLDAPREALAPFEEFDRRLERHIRWEEELLFPEVARKAPQLELGPIRVMKLEHKLIRQAKSEALEALRAGDAARARAAAAEMLEVLGQHNMKEERILYPACDQMLTADEAGLLLSRVRGEG